MPISWESWCASRVHTCNPATQEAEALTELFGKTVCTKFSKVKRMKYLSLMHFKFLKEVNPDSILLKFITLFLLIM